MNVNWLWDSRLNEKEVRSILADVGHPKFNLYAEKLLSRVSEPAVVFGLIDEASFCRRWPAIKKRIKRDRWLKSRVVFWQAMYERVHERLKERGIRLREPEKASVPAERMKLAQQIRAVRMKLGYTQRQAAKRLGVIQQYVSRIESGRENVSVDTLKRIADAFGKELVVELR